MSEKMQWELPGTAGPPPFYYDANNQPRRFVNQPMHGGNWFDDAVSWTGNAINDAVNWTEGALDTANKFAKKTKIISKAAGIGAKVAGFLGQPEAAAPLQGLSTGADMLGYGYRPRPVPQLIIY